MNTRDDLRKIRIEFIRYNEYKDAIPKLKNRIKQAEKDRDLELNDPPYGGSIASIPDNQTDRDTISMKWAKIIADLENEKTHCERRMHIINNWFTILTTEQYNVIKVYLCEFKGENRSTAAAVLKCSEDNVKARTSAGIKRIRRKYKEIL